MTPFPESSEESESDPLEAFLESVFLKIGKSEKITDEYERFDALSEITTALLEYKDDYNPEVKKEINKAGKVVAASVKKTAAEAWAAGKLNPKKVNVSDRTKAYNEAMKTLKADASPAQVADAIAGLKADPLFSGLDEELLSEIVGNDFIKKQQAAQIVELPDNVAE